MRRNWLTLLILLIIRTSAAQLPVLHWAKSFNEHNQGFPGTVYSNGRSVAVDHQGNVYSAGLFGYTVDFDPGPGIYDLSATGPFETSVYISKLSPAGDFLWAIQVPTIISWGNIEIAVDGFDNVYLVAYISTPTDFDPGPGVYTVTPIGANDAFVAKYDTNGNLVWVKQFGGTGDTVPRSDVVTIDKDNNVIVGGHFNNTVDFDPGPNTYNITSSAHIQSFLVKLSNGGDFIWAKQFGNGPVVYAGSYITDIKCDQQGNIYTNGGFQGLCDFDPGPNNYPLQSFSFSDGFISKLDANGNFVWAKRIGLAVPDLSGHTEPHGIAVDNNNNVYTTGAFTGNHDFDPGPATPITPSNPYSDWYLLKLNEQGDFEWVDVFGGYDQDIGADVEVDVEGNILSVGPIGHSADMDPGPGVYNITTVNQYGASAIVKVNPTGQFICAGSFESVNDAYGSTLTRRMAVDNYMNIYVAGTIGGTVDFDPGSGVYPVTSGSYGSPMVFKMGRCLNFTTSTLNVSTCNSYTLNNETFDSSGTYIRTIPNAAGCDSIITLHLTINKKITEQSVSICEGSSFFAGGADQTTSGTYVDTLQTSLSCDSIVTTHLTVHPSPQPNLGADRDLCAGTQTVITPGSFTSYLWQDGSIASSFTATGVGTYYVTVGDNHQCKASDTIHIITLLPSPTAFLPRDTAICSYGDLQIKSSGSFSAYLWSNNASSSSITVTSPGIYWLQVKDGHDCTGRDSILVNPKECLKGFYIPNAFTPDKNGRNDDFKPFIGGVVKQYQFSVYNRWGQMVFTTRDLNKGWDGSFGGKEQDTSVFAWICTYQFEGESVKVERGTVVVIR